jgi:hypothetical protein
MYEPITEPEPWTFSHSNRGTYEYENSSGTESSDDEQLFSKTKTIGKKKFKKLVRKEDLLPE